MTVMSFLAPLLRWQLECIYAAAPLRSESRTELPDTHSSPSPSRHLHTHYSTRHSHDELNNDHYDDDDSEISISSNTFNLAMVFTIHLLSPILSAGVVLSTWVAAFFWFYTKIIGDPEGPQTAESRGSDGRYIYGERREENDGRASVLAVRAWWRGWLVGAMDVEHAVEGVRES
jgi:hypothetical protein